jgi:hypothetical protein
MVDQFIAVSSSGFALGVQGATASPVAFPPGLFRGVGGSDLNWRANALFPDCPDGDFPNVATLPSATGVAVLGTGEGEGRNPLITSAPTADPGGLAGIQDVSSGLLGGRPAVHDREPIHSDHKEHAIAGLTVLNLDFILDPPAGHDHEGVASAPGLFPGQGATCDQELDPHAGRRSLPLARSRGFGGNTLRDQNQRQAEGQTLAGEADPANRLSESSGMVVGRFHDELQGSGDRTELGRVPQ